ncbi:MAG: hypothetical protein ACI8W3_003531 [Myxococcota bacterium]|jgi:hypothetical protein
MTHPLTAARLVATFAMLSIMVAGASHAESQSDFHLKYSMGIDYSRGDYGIEDPTKILFVPLSVEANFTSFRIRATLPFVAISGPTSIALDSDNNADGYDTNSYEGFGQMSWKLGYFISPIHELAPWLEASVKLTMPTESNDSLGSGEWGFSMQMDAFKRYGRFTPFARIGGTFYSGHRLKDRLYTSIGTSFSVTERISAGVAHDWFEASIDNVEDTNDIVAFASFRTENRWSIGPYALAGLSDGSPDYGVGLTFTYRLE